MFRKKKLFIISVILTITFLITTNYLLTTLIKASENEVKSIHERIYDELDKLPDQYKTPESSDDSAINNFVKNLNTIIAEQNLEKLWKIGNSWISKSKIVDFNSLYTGTILQALKKSKILKADLDTRGTQLKFLLTLEGNQNVIFKPKWYDKETIIEGPVYAGKDRYQSEIIGFYLSALLNMPLTPCSVARNISLTNDIIPVGTKQLINTSFEVGNKTCVFGNCFYCKRQDPICENKNLSLTGAVIFNINASLKSYRSPWQRTYKKNKKATWEESDNYCKYVKQKITKRRLLDLIDTSVFDFLIQNGDRHHYETLNDNVVLIDNGKGFGNPNISHLDILAPLYQCCILRSTTLQKLRSLSGGKLRRKLELMPDVKDLLTEAQLTALERRLLIIFATIEYCKNQNRVTQK